MALLKCPSKTKDNFIIINTDNLVTIFWYYNRENKVVVLTGIDVNNKEHIIHLKLPNDVDQESRLGVWRYMEQLLIIIANRKHVNLIDPPTQGYLNNIEYIID